MVMKTVQHAPLPQWLCALCRLWTIRPEKVLVNVNLILV